MLPRWWRAGERGRGLGGLALRKSQPLMIIEAMKMEHTIVAPADGIVEAVHFVGGERVDERAPLLDLKAGH